MPAGGVGAVEGAGRSALIVFMIFRPALVRLALLYCCLRLPVIDSSVGADSRNSARLVCDGKGGCHAEGTQSINGDILPLVDESATYIVNPYCPAP